MRSVIRYSFANSCRLLVQLHQDETHVPNHSFLLLGKVQWSLGLIVRPELEETLGRQPKNITITKKNSSTVPFVNTLPIPEGTVRRDVLCINQWSYIQRIFEIVNYRVDPKVMVGDTFVVEHILTSKLAIY